MHSAHTCTGDGGGMVLRRVFRCRHGVRAVSSDRHLRRRLPDHRRIEGRGGYLTNADGERFMERYAPNAKDLASRDVVSRSMTVEIREGRGVGKLRDHIDLHLEHLGPRSSRSGCPGSRKRADFRQRGCQQGSHPGAAHGALQHGGHTVQRAGRSGLPSRGLRCRGFRLDGGCEAACVSYTAPTASVQLAADLVVFGREAARHCVQAVKPGSPHRPLKADCADPALSRLDSLRNAKGSRRTADIAWICSASCRATPRFFAPRRP